MHKYEVQIQTITME